MDFSQLDLRVGKILNISHHPNADVLYIEDVDVGEENPRHIVCIHKTYINYTNFILKYSRLWAGLPIFFFKLKTFKNENNEDFTKSSVLTKVSIQQ